jgi:serine/threonine-protein kinase
MAGDGDRTRVTLVDPLIGEVIADRYRLEVRLGAGAFGAIYHAIDLDRGREVAIKIVHASLAGDTAVAARFRREGDLLVRLRDPHTVRAFEVGELEDRRVYIVMERLYGESLEERLSAGPLPWQRAVAIARAICASLGEAHALDIVHRDLKPANIVLEPRPEAGTELVKVLDFGIAKPLHGDDLTGGGQMIGTFDYMSPEQMLGGECTGRSDIFALGVLVYEMVAGERPFGEARSAAAMLKTMLHAPPAPLRDAPAELDRVVRRCLRHDPLARFADVAELDAALARAGAEDEVRRGPHVVRRPPTHK